VVPTWSPAVHGNTLQTWVKCPRSAVTDVCQSESPSSDRSDTCDRRPMRRDQSRHDVPHRSHDGIGTREGFDTGKRVSDQGTTPEISPQRVHGTNDGLQSTHLRRPAGTADCQPRTVLRVLRQMERCV
jgi:hypothetical protein